MLLYFRHYGDSCRLQGGVEQLNRSLSVYNACKEALREKLGSFSGDLWWKIEQTHVLLGIAKASAKKETSSQQDMKMYLKDVLEALFAFATCSPWPLPIQLAEPLQGIVCSIITDVCFVAADIHTHTNHSHTSHTTHDDKRRFIWLTRAWRLLDWYIIIHQLGNGIYPELHNTVAKVMEDTVETNLDEELELRYSILVEYTQKKLSAFLASMKTLHQLADTCSQVYKGLDKPLMALEIYQAYLRAAELHAADGEVSMAEDDADRLNDMRRQFIQLALVCYETCSTSMSMAYTPAELTSMLVKAEGTLLVFKPTLQVYDMEMWGDLYRYQGETVLALLIYAACWSLLGIRTNSLVRRLAERIVALATDEVCVYACMCVCVLCYGMV
ncbi:hypothetical protein EON63_18755 [archaeon]|nr:MAG: hypothetical protein EON63_18755 [archaeon]